MKTLFLLSGLITFSFASGQNNDLFDINQHLKQLNGKKQVELEKQKLLYPFHGRSFVFKGKKNKPYMLMNGDKIVTLSGYNMPCVIPDMNQFHTMPIAGENLNMKSYRIMPNSAPLFNNEDLLKKSKK